MLGSAVSRSPWTPCTRSTHRRRTCLRQRSCPCPPPPRARPPPATTATRAASTVATTRGSARTRPRRTARRATTAMPARRLIPARPVCAAGQPSPVARTRRVTKWQRAIPVPDSARRPRRSRTASPAAGRRPRTAPPSGWLRIRTIRRVGRVASRCAVRAIRPAISTPTPGSAASSFVCASATLTPTFQSARPVRSRLTSFGSRHPVPGMLRPS